jgi:protein O-GlcNAc transferase
MDLEELLRRYEAEGDETIYLEARAAYEVAIEAAPTDARLQHQYGYLRECHARNELREAAARYERAIDLDPEWAKPRYQLLAAKAALLEIRDEIRAHHARLAAHPDDTREYRFLASAYLLAQQPEKADETALSGLRLTPDDAHLTRARAEAAAAMGRTADALTLWRRALEVDPDDISGLYSAAFLLEREGRLEEAALQWRAIVEWCVARGYEVEARWPRRELTRLER